MGEDMTLTGGGEKRGLRPEPELIEWMYGSNDAAKAI